MTERDYDFIIVGAGIAGPALAVAFARKGRTVLVVERDLREPDRIVGELLQPGGIEALRKLGMDDCVDGIDAVPTYGYKIFFHGEEVQVPYPPIEIDGKPTKASGRGFHHGKFVMKLREKARGTPGVTFLEATVTEILTNPHTGHVLGVKTTSKTGGAKHYFASITVVCDGISSKFRKTYTSKIPEVKSHFVGLILEDADIPAPNHGHVIIGDHQPILVYQISEHDTRILCDIKGPLPSISNGDMKRYLETTVLPNLPASLRPSFTKAIETPRLRTMPSQFLPATQNKTPGLVLVGDAMNMRHPLTGGGMTVAFKDAVLLGDLLGPDLVPDLANDTKVLAQLKNFFFLRKKSCSVINVLAMALYSLFAADDDNLRVLQRGCFDYFGLGGNCVLEPTGLLGGIISRPWVLFYHFFSVAFYGIYINFAKLGLAGAPTAFIQVFTVLYTACAVFLPFMYEELKRW